MHAIQSIKAIQYRAYGGYAENRFVDLPAPALAPKRRRRVLAATSTSSTSRARASGTA